MLKGKILTHVRRVVYLNVFIEKCATLNINICENDQMCSWEVLYLINIHYYSVWSKSLASFLDIPVAGVVREEHAHSLTPQHGTHRPVAALVCLTAAAKRQLRATMMTSPPSHHPKYLQNQHPTLETPH
jgi:hypothetical protein